MSIRSHLLVILLLVPAFVGLRSAEEMEVPVAVQFSIFVKVLEMDRALADRAGESITVGILYQSRVRESHLAKDELLEHFNGLSEIRGIPLRVIALESQNADGLRRQIRQQGIDVLYLGPLRAVDIHQFTAVTRAEQVLTLTGVPAFVDDGVSVGIGLAANRPQLLVNLEAAQAEGAQFDARLLKLARIIE